MQPLICLRGMTGTVMPIILTSVPALSKNHISFWEKLAGFCPHKIINNKNHSVPNDALPHCSASFLFKDYKAEQKEFYFHTTLTSQKTQHSLS